jgi:hypothetical protein
VAMLVFLHAFRADLLRKRWAHENSGRYRMANTVLQTSMLHVKEGCIGNFITTILITANEIDIVGKSNYKNIIAEN